MAEVGGGTIPAVARQLRERLEPIRRCDPVMAAVVAVGIAAGFVLRWHVLRGPLGYVDLDEATAGVQARRLLSEPAVFFPRQPYGGTIEGFLLAPVVRLWSGALALKSVPILLHGIAALVTWRAAVRIVPSRLGQVVAPLAMWIGPGFAVWESTKERGFYGATIVLGAIAIWAAALLVEDASWRRAVGFGAAGGVALWTSPLLALVYVPCGVWAIARRPAILRKAPAIAGAAIVGAAPWIAWNLRNGWASLAHTDVPTLSHWGLLRNGLAKVPPMLGASTPWNPSRTIVPGATILVGIGVVAALLAATLRTRRSAPGLLAAVLLGFAALYPFVVTLGATGPDLRYLYPLVPALALVLGAVTPDPDARLARVAIVSAVIAVVAGTSWWALAGMERAAHTDTVFLAAPGIDDVVAFLEDRGIERATTDLAGAQITYASDGRVRAASFWTPRFADLQRTMLVEEPSVYVLETGRLDNDRRLEAAATERGITYERHEFGVWSVYVLDEWLPPWEAGLVVYGGPVTEANAMRTD